MSVDHPLANLPTIPFEQLLDVPAMALSGLGFGLFVPPVIDIVLVNVDRARAGIASGALATMQQVGGAIGVALLGIIFLGLLGHNAPAAARAQSATVRSALVADAAPAASADRATGSFDRCFTERARAIDPTITPSGCALPASTSQAVKTSYITAAKRATAHDFSTSFSQALGYRVAIYLAVVCLLWRLPRANPRQLAQSDPAMSGA